MRLGFHKTLQKGFRRTGNPDLVNDISWYNSKSAFKSHVLGIIQDEFLFKHDDKSRYWYQVSKTKGLGELFILKFQHKLCFTEILKNQTLSESFMRGFQFRRVGWWIISAHQKLSEAFIKEFKDKVDWDTISIHQTLSESFIRKFQDKVDWDCISLYQKLGEPFIREFGSKINWRAIWCYQILSDSFKKEFGHTIN